MNENAAKYANYEVEYKNVITYRKHEDDHNRNFFPQAHSRNAEILLCVP